MILFIIMPILVIAGALMDGFQHSNRKLTGSFFKTLFLIGIALGFYFKGEGYHIVYFFLCWWVLFDPIYNPIRGKKPFYVGTTKWTDRLLRWLCDELPIFNKFAKGQYSHISFITKLMALVVAIGLIIRL